MDHRTQLAFFKDILKTYGAFISLNSIPMEAEVANGSSRQTCSVQSNDYRLGHLTWRPRFLSPSKARWSASQDFPSLNHNELALSTTFSSAVHQLPSLPNFPAPAPRTYLYFQSDPYRPLHDLRVNYIVSDLGKQTQSGVSLKFQNRKQERNQWRE